MRLQGRAAIVVAVGAGLLLGGLAAAWSDAPANGKAPSRAGQRLAQQAPTVGYRLIIPMSARGTNLTSSTFVPISVTVPPVATAVTTSDRAVELTLPAGVATGSDGQAVSVRLDVRTASPPQTTGVGGLRAVQIDMTRPDGSAVRQLARPIEVVLHFSDADLAREGVSAAGLQIQYSEDGVTWTAVPTTVEGGQARAVVDHLTIFALVGPRTAGGAPVPPAPATPTPTAVAAGGTPMPTAVTEGTPTATPAVSMTAPAGSSPTAAPNPGGGGGGGTVAPTATRTAAPAVATNERYGVAIAVGGTNAAAVENVKAQTLAGSWYTYSVPAATGPPGKVFLLRTQARALSSSQDATIQAVARARPGSYWMVGNEPNIPGEDYDTGISLDANAARYVADYRRYRAVVLAADPTARFVFGNTLNLDETCNQCVTFFSGRAFLNAVVAAHGGPLPADTIWGVHSYAVDWAHEPADANGVEMMSNSNMTNPDVVIREIQRFRTFVDAQGYSDRPIWLTEFGIIWGYAGRQWVRADGSPCPDDEAECWLSHGGTTRKDGEMNNYIARVSDWLNANRAAYRVDRWFLYSSFSAPQAYANVWGGISLMSDGSAAATLTSFGQTYRGRAAAP